MVDSGGYHTSEDRLFRRIQTLFHYHMLHRDIKLESASYSSKFSASYMYHFSSYQECQDEDNWMEPHSHLQAPLFHQDRSSPSHIDGYKKVVDSGGYHTSEDRLFHMF